MSGGSAAGAGAPQQALQGAAHFSRKRYPLNFVVIVERCAFYGRTLDGAAVATATAGCVPLQAQAQARQDVHDVHVAELGEETVELGNLRPWDLYLRYHYRANDAFPVSLSVILLLKTVEGGTLGGTPGGTGSSDPAWDPVQVPVTLLGGVTLWQESEGSSDERKHVDIAPRSVRSSQTVMLLAEEPLNPALTGCTLSISLEYYTKQVKQDGVRVRSMEDMRANMYEGLSKRVSGLLHDKRFQDVSLVVGTVGTVGTGRETIPANRALLSAASPVLTALLNSTPTPTSVDVTSLLGAHGGGEGHSSASLLKEFVLPFMYSSNVDRIRGKGLVLAKIALQLQFEDLWKFCMVDIRNEMTQCNVVTVYATGEELARLYQNLPPGHRPVDAGPAFDFAAGCQQIMDVAARFYGLCHPSVYKSCEWAEALRKHATFEVATRLHEHAGRLSDQTPRTFSPALAVDSGRRED